ncbi:MAG: hypothetical protein J7500_00790 [Sphingomonas sp.]|uniref:hypothetical protein n=1 Tax=Sphingomonas sp. TaxID=28214 RepID=UPI001B141B84|nr:hypothetical protein [Sphingomonas sp.]MBO9621225.1 hypothetical protein [Sphingomonas sp.]
MSYIALIAYAGVALLATQGAFLLLAPRRAAQYTLWKHSLIGAPPAEPGPGTFLLYRIAGVAMFGGAAFLLTTFVSE